MYLAVVLDVFNYLVVGWAMVSHLRVPLVLKALGDGLVAARPPGCDSSLLHRRHSGLGFLSPVQFQFKRHFHLPDSPNVTLSPKNGVSPLIWGGMIMDEIYYTSFSEDERSAGSETTPALKWEQDAAKRAIDELFTLARRYKSKRSYRELMQFIARFRFYSPFNAMLVHVQMPGAKYVAPAHRWLRDFGRRVKAGARPLVILQPMGPVMFVFDVSDTEPTEDERPLPVEVYKPFEVRKGNVGNRLEQLIENAKRDGVRISTSHEGSQSAGSIRRVKEEVKAKLHFHAGKMKDGSPMVVEIPVRYELVVNAKLTREEQYATIVHELAHLYCGHLGTPNEKWWPDRRGLNHTVREFEAESVAYLVCSRADIDNPSEKYLAHFISQDDDIPQISLECVMKAAGLIETMSLQRMKPRKPSTK